ncbi:MAG: hypothetical protein IJ426_01290 [Clostridia bacterium]|nr:hypothetical protein [Clostridia bacterium]
MRNSFSAKLMLLVCLLLVATTVGGVFATWRYAEDPASTVQNNVPFMLGEFTWEGSDILPDDVEGEDHAWLIKSLVSGESGGKVIGLDNPNSALNDYINDRLSGGLGWKRDYFGSMAVTGDEEMEALFGAAAEGLSFIIQVKSSTEYYIFTTSVDLGERGEANWLGTGNRTPGKPNVPLGSYVEYVYRTKITRPSTSDKWDIIETKRGKAISDWYDENRRNANITQIPAFDPNTWVES